MKSPNTQAKAAPYRPRRATLNWVDYLVIAATALTFAVVVAGTHPRVARAHSQSTVIPATELPAQANAPGEQPGLIKARIGLALAGR